MSHTWLIEVQKNLCPGFYCPKFVLSGIIKTMSMKKFLFPLFLCFALTISCERTEQYQVYALNYQNEGKYPAKELVIGSNPTDSIIPYDMFWLLKSEGGKNILVDVGLIDSTNSNKSFIRPDSLLQKFGISSQSISGIILTHPHNDHIGGITLFPKAHFWIQKKDYEYFVSPQRLENKDTEGFNPTDVKNLIAVNDQGRLTLINGDDIEIMPGIRVFTGSKHTYENQYLLINSNAKKNKILLASDAIWFYVNLEKLLPITLCRDTGIYVTAIKRMKTLVSNQNLIIPGHDGQVFSKFPTVQDRIVRIEE
jgi:glyoxylase-like metal-dependent hydrolase (beta-lactamase superfamily II)